MRLLERRAGVIVDCVRRRHEALGQDLQHGDAWQRLGQGINLVQPTGDGDGVLNFLGCEHRSSETVIAGIKVKTIEWDAVSSLRRCIAKYEEAVRSVTGMYPRMANADTPLVHEETTSLTARACVDEAFYECPSCLDTFPKSFMEQQCFFEAGCNSQAQGDMASYT